MRDQGPEVDRGRAGHDVLQADRRHGDRAHRPQRHGRSGAPARAWAAGSVSDSVLPPRPRAVGEKGEQP